MGFLDPAVILPDVQFKEKELIMILSHELVHIKHSSVQEKESNISNERTLEVDVPFIMKYQDLYADPPFDIDIQSGKQLLKGDKAEAYIKFRKSN